MDTQGTVELFSLKKNSSARVMRNTSKKKDNKENLWRCVFGEWEAADFAEGAIALFNGSMISDICSRDSVRNIDTTSLTSGGAGYR